jgi:hypothetical protein
MISGLSFAAISRRAISWRKHLAARVCFHVVVSIDMWFVHLPLNAFKLLQRWQSCIEIKISTTAPPIQYKPIMLPYADAHRAQSEPCSWGKCIGSPGSPPHHTPCMLGRSGHPCAQSNQLRQGTCKHSLGTPRSKLVTLGAAWRRDTLREYWGGFGGFLLVVGILLF